MVELKQEYGEVAEAVLEISSLTDRDVIHLDGQKLPKDSEKLHIIKIDMRFFNKNRLTGNPCELFARAAIPGK